MNNANTTLFNLSERFKVAISLINTIESKKLHSLLTRIVKKLHVKDDSPFTPDEEARLQQVLAMSSNEVQAVLDSCALLFEQAAYFSVSPSRLVTELNTAGMKDEQAQVFQHLWESEKKGVLEKLSENTVNPNVVEDIGWRLHLSMKRSDNKTENLKEPSTLFELSIRDKDTKQVDKVNIEFSHQELFSFFDKLESIQEQLDALG